VTPDLLTILGAGLLTFAAPCVLPLIPIYLAALVGGDVSNLQGAGRGRLLGRAGLFSLGFIAVFTVMGVAVSSVGAFLSEHRVVFQLSGAVLVLGFALKLLGVIQIPALERVARADDTKLQTRFGGINALIMGIVFAAGWSPCVGPVLGSVLTYTASATADPWMGALYLTTYGVGFALPLLLIAAFAKAGLRALDRLKPQLPRLEKVTGVLLLVVTGLLVHGAAQGWDGSASPAAGPAEQPAASSQAPLLAAADPPPASRPPEALPLMVEIYAEGCPICQRMEPLVDRLLSQCDERGVRVRKVDVSRPENRHLASRYRVLGVPTFLFLDAQGEEVARLVGEQTAGTLHQALAALSGEQCAGLGMLPPPDVAAAPAPPAQHGAPAAACSVSPATVAHSDQGPAGGAACSTEAL